MTDLKAAASRVRAIAGVQVGTGGIWLPKFKPNTTRTIRLLPERSKDDPFFVQGKLHYGYEFDGQKRAITCFRFHKDEECPACDFWGWLRDQADPRFKQLSYGVKPKDVYYFNVIDRAGKSFHVMNIGPMIFRGIQTIMNNPRYGDIADPKKGRDLDITRTGSGMEDTEYNVMPDPDTTPIGVSGWEKKAFDLKVNNVDEWSLDDALKAIFGTYGGKVRDLAKIIGVKAPAKKKRGKK